MVGTAVVQQVRDRLPDAAPIDTVDHVPRSPPRSQQACLLQGGKMKGQARRGQAKGLRNLACGHAGIAHRHKHANEIQSRRMRQGRKRCQNLVAVHFTSILASTIQERLK
jgi:hypothetical protein